MTGRRSRHAAGPGRWAGWSALLVVVAAGALVATLPEPPAAQVRPVTPTVEPVSRTAVSCPAGDSGAVVGVASVAGVPFTGDGRVEPVLQQPGEERRTVRLDRGGLVPLPVGGGPVTVRAAGESARGLLAARSERGDGTLSAATCLAARPVWWFSGAGGGVDHGSVLSLTNADEGPAVVDVQLHGASGSVDEARTRGITLAPGETSRLPMTEVAPGSEEVTVEVSATRGRVVAHVLDTVRSGAGEAEEWLSPAPPPAEDVVLPGVPARADRVRLLVTNPGADQALVDLEVLTEDGAFVPLGSEQLSVDPGTIERVDLTEALEGRAAAVRLTAQVPVTGTLRASAGGDVAYAGAALPLTGRSGVVLVGGASVVQVTATDEPASLQLLGPDEEGRLVLRRSVTVPPSGLVRVPVPAGSAYAVVLLRSGTAYAAAVHTGPGLAGQPLMPLPATALRPSVVPYAGQPDS